MASVATQSATIHDAPDAGQINNDDDFDDDFDDFGEGFEQGEHVQDDFDDFGTAETDGAVSTLLPPDLLAHLASIPTILTRIMSDTDECQPPLNLSDKITPDSRQAALTPYLQTIFPDVDTSLLGGTPLPRSKPEPLLSDRSASLWAQLVAPPPLQPPDWTRSKIRRLFLVSLGVPVDLDEIHPGSKQKKLVLPSTRGREELTGGGAKSKDTKGDASHRSSGPAPPEFDSRSARQLCLVQKSVLEAYSDKELQNHLSQLESTTAMADALLEYWLKRKESAVGDKEAFEGVIENLVGFMKKSKTKTKR